MFSTSTKAAANATEASAVNDLKSRSREAIDKIERTASEFYDEASDYAEDATDKVRQVAGRVRSDFNTAKDRATEKVRANPIGSGLAILGVGLVLGYLSRGSRRA